jgi:hypothetical protein
MNTSIGKIHAKTQGTKPHAKAIATAQAPKPATGNVHSASNPLNQGSPLNETEAQKLAKLIKAKGDEYKKKEGIKSIEGKSAGKPKVKAKKAYVKKGGKATGKMSSYKKGSKERYAEYEARGWKQDDTTKGGEGVSTTSTKSPNTTPKKELIAKTFKEEYGDNAKNNNLVSKSRATTEKDKPKAESKRGDKLRDKADNAKSVAEKNRLQNRADRKDGRAERRAARVARRSGNMTKAEAKTKIKESRSKQKSTAKRSTAPQSGQINNVKGSAGDKKRKTIKNANRFSVDTKNLGQKDLLKSKKKKLTLANALNNK